MYAEQGKEVRIEAYGSSPGYRHAEPQVKESGTWKYIKKDCTSDITTTEPDFNNRTSIRYYTIHDYLYRIGVKL